GLLLIAARAAECRIEPSLPQGIEQRLRLKQGTAFLRAQSERIRALLDGFTVGVNDEFRADLACEAVTEFDHLVKLIGSVDVQQWKWDLAGINRLLSQSHHYRGILADGIEHHRPREFSRHLAEDVDALRLERTQVAESESICSRRSQS